MTRGRVVEEQPERHPHQADGAGDHERGPPVVGENRPDDQRRRQHRADRGAEVEDAARQAALLRREPFRRRFHAAGIGASLGEAEQPAQHRERRPAMREAVRHAHQRPGDREHCKARFQSDDVEDVAADRLQHDRPLERPDDPRVLLGGDVQLLEDGRSGHAERAPRQVVDDRADHHQRDHPPAQ